MATEKQIGTPDYAGVWFDKTRYSPFGLTPTVGPFIVYLDDALSSPDGIIVDQIGLAKFKREKPDGEKIRFTKTYITDALGRERRQEGTSHYYYSGTQDGSLISGNWEIVLEGRKYSGEFLMQPYDWFMKGKKGMPRIANAWLDAQMEFLQNKYLAGIEAKLIGSARKEVLIIE